MRVMQGLAGLVLAGCAVNSVAPPGVTTVAAVARSGVAAPLAQGETQLVVRTVPAGDARQELRGVACRAETAWFTADFATPARLLMPDYGAQAPVVVVNCRSGELAGQGAASPQAAWSGGLGGWPAVGISVGTGSAEGVGVGMGWYGAGVGASTGVPVTRYPELRVEMR
jgi:hypothetical protein